MKNIGLKATDDTPPELDTGLLVGWLNRTDLARELTLSVDTLQRWETRRVGPPLRSGGAQGALPDGGCPGLAARAGSPQGGHQPCCRRSALRGWPWQTLPPTGRFRSPR